ncbi:hypothetical protein D3C85_1773630 [compost metagenome]
MLLAALAQDQVDTAIRAVAAGFADAKSLTTEGFANQVFELLPTDALDGFSGAAGAGDVVD